MATDEAHLRQRILEAIPDATVEVVDYTGGGDHFRVEVSSARFAGRSLIEQHRMVNDAVAAEFADGSIHAFTIKTRIPEASA